MLYAVVQTHNQGIRLSRETIRTTEPIVGQLEITDWLEGNAERRALRVARLKHPTISYYPELLTPLFDPAIVRMTSQGFLLLGFQIHADEQFRPIEMRQGWWVRFPSGMQNQVTGSGEASRSKVV